MNKQYKITTIGTPDIEKMSKTEQKSFFGSLLALMTEYYYPANKDNDTLPFYTENTDDTGSGQNESNARRVKGERSPSGSAAISPSACAFIDRVQFVCSGRGVCLASASESEPTCIKPSARLIAKVAKFLRV